MFPSPIIVAPMAGGTTTPELALAATRAGAFAYAAGGYKTAQGLAEHLAPLRAAENFGVNIFVPRSAELAAAEVAALASYRTELAKAADRLGVALPQDLPESASLQAQDYWAEKVDLLLQDPVPVVSFTFGLAPESVVASLHRKGTRVVASVTSVPEALAAAATGVDALAVQHSNAGGHSASFLPDIVPYGTQSAPGVVELVAQVRAAVSLPLVGAGGIGNTETAKAVLAAGAQAVQLGTAVLRSDESGARALHKDALGDTAFTSTAVTRAFTGRPARALVNDFVRAHSANAPHAYPEVHFLTAPLRAAAAAAGDREALNLWAGTAWQQAASGPVANIVASFLKGL